MEESGTKLISLEGHEEQIVGYDGVERSRVAEVSKLQSQINRNILDFLLISYEFPATA